MDPEGTGTTGAPSGSKTATGASQKRKKGEGTAGSATGNEKSGKVKKEPNVTVKKEKKEYEKPGQIRDTPPEVS